MASLTACLLVRNEQANLDRALKSLANAVDETIVVDTGSTDRTLDIARALHAAVFEFPWNDDFGAARTFMIHKVRTDWILFLDADEELLAESVPELRRCIAIPDAMGFHLLRRDLSVAEDLKSGTEMWVLRLFRRREDLRLVGRCHADFRPSLQDRAALEGKRVYHSTIRLRHYGYTADRRPAKLRRAARLLAMELADRPGQIYYQIELGRTLLLLNDPAGHRVLYDATRQMIAARNSPVPPVPLVAALLEYLLIAPTQDSQCPLNAEELSDLCQRWFPKSAPLLWLQAGAKYRAEDFAAAAQLLEQLIDLGRSDSYDKTTSFDPRILGDDAMLNLAACYTRLAKLDKAERLLHALATRAATSAAAKQNLAVIEQLRRGMAS
jgi:hypothetical protein